MTQINETVKSTLKFFVEKIDLEAGFLIQKADEIKKIIKDSKENGLIFKKGVFNSLGELQGNCLELDRAIIAFENYKRAIRDLTERE